MPETLEKYGRRALDIVGNVALMFLLGTFAAAVLWGLIRVFVEDPCNPYLLLQASESMKNVVFSCGEFWINRYQGLLGNVLTASVAFITLNWLTQQLTAANRQAAVAAAAGLRVKINDLEKERASYKDALGQIATIRRNGWLERVEITRWHHVRSLRTELHQAQAVLRAATEIASRVIERGDPTRRKIMERLNKMSLPVEDELMRSLERKAQTFEHNPDSIEPSNLEAAGKIYLDIIAVGESIESLLRDATSSVDSQITRTWGRIAEFEDEAVR